ncbi:hypothetical protein WL30_24595 [Burkholderia ubonensis]|uniref:hypothetical protein n=1 Tax=Burkholderia ubonensis TaxID=101571 RepID=UPI00075E45F8|nr:hypothetical protein [Burkholderia ubonensis]KWA81694.1 hypothetical protein WL30_24595 [Burkholderia ubonensis]KWB34714.1 hypothetical protein WL31_22285 [Burkholderia ubonensis]
MNDDDQNPMTGQTRTNSAPVRTFVEIPGGTRTDFPDGSHLVEGPEGDKYLVSEAGDITATIPEIRRVQIDDLSLVLRHEIVYVHETMSHTLHFAGGGVFSYLHHRNGRGMSIQANRVLFHTLPGGVIIVCGTMPNTAAGGLPAPVG